MHQFEPPRHLVIYDSARHQDLLDALCTQSLLQTLSHNKNDTADRAGCDAVRAVFSAPTCYLCSYLTCLASRVQVSGWRSCLQGHTVRHLGVGQHASGQPSSAGKSHAPRPACTGIVWSSSPPPPLVGLPLGAKRGINCLQTTLFAFILSQCQLVPVDCC